MFNRSVKIPLLLFILTGITTIVAAVQAAQILTGTLPEDLARLSTTPISHFTHAAGGSAFAILGPLQFGRVIARRYGRIHRVMGRVFVVSGLAIAFSSLSLLWRFWEAHSILVSTARLIFAIALVFALIRGVNAIRQKNITAHRDWMIRAYAIGVGATVIAIVFIPIYAITKAPPEGLLSDLIFIGSWAACVGFAEMIIRRFR